MHARIYTHARTPPPPHPPHTRTHSRTHARIHTHKSCHRSLPGRHAGWVGLWPVGWARSRHTAFPHRDVCGTIPAQKPAFPPRHHSQKSGGFSYLAIYIVLTYYWWDNLHPWRKLKTETEDEAKQYLPDCTFWFSCWEAPLQSNDNGRLIQFWNECIRSVSRSPWGKESWNHGTRELCTIQHLQPPTPSHPILRPNNTQLFYVHFFYLSLSHFPFGFI